MAFKFQTLQTGNNFLDRVQANIQSAFNAITGPFVGGILLQNVSVGASATVINHGLNRMPQVWTLCDQNTNTNVWRTAWDENSITLQAGSACIVTLWVN
jgi:hypothetical protein